MALVELLRDLIYLALGIVALGIELWAFADCARRKPTEFERAYKRTKGFWMGLTGGAAAVGLLSVLLFGPLALLLFELAAVVAASVYLADVRPALNESKGRGGAYGSW